MDKPAKAHIAVGSNIDIKEARKQLGITQAQLAKELEWSTQQVSNVETGERDLQRQTQLAVECLLRRQGLWR